MGKTELYRKYVEKEPFMSAELRWMGENDWHPVDMQQMKPDSIKEIQRRSKGRFIKAKSVGEIFEFWR